MSKKEKNAYTKKLNKRTPKKQQHTHTKKPKQKKQQHWYCSIIKGLPFRSGRAQSCSSMTTPSRTGSMGVMSNRSKMIGCQKKKEITEFKCNCIITPVYNYISVGDLVLCDSMGRPKPCTNWIKCSWHKIRFIDFKDSPG